MTLSESVAGALLGVASTGAGFHLNHGCLTRGDSPRGHSAMSGDICDGPNRGERAAPGVQEVERPGMLLNALQLAGQPHDKEPPSPQSWQC